MRLLGYRELPPLGVLAVSTEAMLSSSDQVDMLCLWREGGRFSCCTVLAVRGAMPLASLVWLRGVSPPCPWLLPSSELLAFPCSRCSWVPKARISGLRNLPADSSMPRGRSLF